MDTILLIELISLAAVAYILVYFYGFSLLRDIGDLSNNMKFAGIGFFAAIILMIIMRLVTGW